jgi:hypothetical protein
MNVVHLENATEHVLQRANSEGDQALVGNGSMKTTALGSTKVSNYVTGASHARTASDTVMQQLQPLSPLLSPLGQALLSLERLVKIVDGISEVIKICCAIQRAKIWNRARSTRSAWLHGGSSPVFIRRLSLLNRRTFLV